jgi:hypothetical protein
MKTINLIEIAKAKKELNGIEYDFRHIENDLCRELDIWEQIASNLNSSKNDEQRNFWELVMDLYNFKYKNGMGVDESLKIYLN